MTMVLSSRMKFGDYSTSLFTLCRAKKLISLIDWSFTEGIDQRRKIQRVLHACKPSICTLVASANSISHVVALTSCILFFFTRGKWLMPKILLPRINFFVPSFSAEICNGDVLVSPLSEPIRRSLHFFLPPKRMGAKHISPLLLDSSHGKPISVPGSAGSAPRIV